MNFVVKVLFTAALFALFGNVNAQVADTVDYDENESRYQSDNTSLDDRYNTDTTGRYGDEWEKQQDREQQGEDTFNETRDETKYSNDGRNPGNDNDPSGGANTIDPDASLIPSSDSAHRQAREELNAAADTLNYDAARKADPEKAGITAEHAADTALKKAERQDGESR